MITHHQFIELVPGQAILYRDKIAMITDIRQSHGITLEIMTDSGRWISVDSDDVNDIRIDLNHYGYLDALNDLADVQFINNTIQEAEVAKAEVVKIIKGLCGVE